MPAAFTPYAVQLRYDQEFWPDQAAAAEACSMAQQVVGLVESILRR